MKFAPLPGTFMITSIVGFAISAIYIWNLSETWGFAFSLIFVLMFVASMISLSKAAVPEHVSIHPVKGGKK